jgi:proteasome lid subunit RPN8/RPN11
MYAALQPRCLVRRPPRLVFSPLAWMKLQYFCHAVDTEIGGFAIARSDDLLYVEEFVTVRQKNSDVTVEMDDQAVADFLDRCVDAGLPPAQVMRIWIHTHPGSSPEPSYVDETTFARVFGRCDWAVLFILDRAGNTYARLALNVGPGGAIPLPVCVAWSDWPGLVNDAGFPMPECLAAWRTELATNIQSIPETLKLFPATALNSVFDIASPWEPFPEPGDWTDLDQELWEDIEHHERISDNTKRA